MARMFLLALFQLNFFQPSFSQELLPDHMVGRWEGYLQLWSKGEKKDSVKVNLTIAALGKDSWQWKMDYLSDKNPMTKDYVLRLRDREKQLFITDEGGGVELEDYVFGNKMFSLFETGEFWLTSTQELKGDQLIFEVTAGKKSAVLEKGVTNYSVTSMQRAIMKRNLK